MREIKLEYKEYSILEYVENVGWNVIFCTWIEIIFGSQNRWFCARVLFLQSVPKMAIVFLLINIVAKNIQSLSVHCDVDIDVRRTFVDVFVKPNIHDARNRSEKRVTKKIRLSVKTKLIGYNISRTDFFWQEDIDL